MALLLNTAFMPCLSGDIYCAHFPRRVGSTYPKHLYRDIKEGINIEAHTAWVGSIHKRNSKVGKRQTVGLQKRYRVIPAYYGEFDEHTIQEIKANPDIEQVIQDTTVKFGSPLTSRALTTQSNSPNTGLASLSHRAAGATDYIYDSSAGEGTYGYVVDTGIQTTHVDFEGRATLGYNAMDDADVDLWSHGTHVASTMCGAQYDVAKKCNLISVRVFKLDFGVASIILDGWDWAINDIVTKGRQNVSVINLSLESPYDSIWEIAAKTGFDNGVVSVAAAGNAGRGTRGAPAGCPGVIGVGAVDAQRRRWEYSNFGSWLEVFAPGVDVRAAMTGDSNTRSAALSGTSMASPHVAGLALYLQRLENIASPTAMLNRILELSTKNIVTDSGSESPNLMAYNGNGA